MLRHVPGKFHDFGSTVLGIAGLVALGVAMLQALALAYVNHRWPPMPMQQVQQQAVQRGSAGLARIEKADLLFQVRAAPIQDWLARELQKAAARLNEANPDLQLKIDDLRLGFEAQRVVIRARYQLNLLREDLELAGAVEGFGYLALDGAELSLRPALGALKLGRVSRSGGTSWWLPAAADLVFAQLSFVRDNLNGQLPSWAERLPIAPLTVPGQPRPAIPVVFPDPFRPGESVTASFVPPVLAGAALLADDDRLTVLGDLSLDTVDPPATPPAGTDDFLVYRREFAGKLRRSGLAADPSSAVSFDVADGFVQKLFERFTGQAFARDRVSEAVRDSYAALPRLARPEVAVSLDSALVAGLVERELQRSLGAWASSQSGTVTTASFEVRPQHMWAAASTGFRLPQLGAVLHADLAVAVPVAGTAAGIRLYPAIDKLAITRLQASSLGDLTGLMRGINTFLAAAVAAANASLRPIDAGLDPLQLDPIDFTGLGSSSVVVSPPAFTPPPLQTANTALLLDASRILVMADIAAPGAAPPPASSPVTDFETYRKAYHARWSERFGEPTRPGAAHAYLATAAVARYVNSAVASADVSLSATMGESSSSTTPLEIGEIPQVRCRGLFDCPSCKWYEIWCHPIRLACEATNAAITTACSVGLEPARWAINEIVRILGRDLGDLKTEAQVRANARVDNIRLRLAEDLSRVDLDVAVAADAYASADIRFHAKSVSGVLLCPFDFHHHVPAFGGEIHGRLPAQQAAMGAGLATQVEQRPGGNWRLSLQMTPQNDIPIHGELGTSPYLQLRLAILSMNIQCPLTNAINVLVPGLGTVLGLLDIGQITALVTEGVAQGALDGLAPEVKALFLGRIDTKLAKPGPVRFAIDLPVVRAGDQAFVAKPEIRDGLIQVHLEQPPERR